LITDLIKSTPNNGTVLDVGCDGFKQVVAALKSSDPTFATQLLTILTGHLWHLRDSRSKSLISTQRQFHSRTIFLISWSRHI